MPDGAEDAGGGSAGNGSLRLLHADLCAAFPLARAGGHRTIHSLLLHLSREPGTRCLSLAPRRGLGSQLPEYDPPIADFEALGVRSVAVEPGRWSFDCGYPQWAVDDVEAVFDDALASFQPDVLWANCFRSLPLLRRARAAGHAALFYLHDARPQAAELREAAALGVELCAVSRFIAERAERLSGAVCPVVYPLIAESDYADGPGSEAAAGACVTFINPRPVKGYEVFLGLPPLLPEVRFLVVEAWPLGAERATVEARLAAFPNVRFLRQLPDLRAVYRETAVLLVPSVVEEGGPRVVREAQLRGIPVLGSTRGAVPEMVGAGGLIVAEDQDPRAWAAALRSVLGEDGRREALGRAALANARREELCTPGVLRRFREACERARARAAAERAA